MRLKRFFATRTALNTAIGVVFAIIAGLLLLGYLSNAIRGDAGREVLDIPVAASDIQPGAVISARMVGVAKVARRYLVPGTLRDRDSITGARALRFIGRGEPFTSPSLARPGSSGALAARIPSDLRAYSLRLAAFTAAGTDICPGDRVDVLSTGSDPPVTRTLLKQRLVLSSGVERAGGGGGTPDQPRILTLLVSPSEAEMLAQAECTGEISVSLCPAAD